MNKINAEICSFIEFLHKSVTFIEAFRRLKAAFILNISVSTKTPQSTSTQALNMRLFLLVFLCSSSLTSVVCKPAPPPTTGGGSSTMQEAIWRFIDSVSEDLNQVTQMAVLQYQVIPLLSTSIASLMTTNASLFSKDTELGAAIQEKMASVIQALWSTQSDWCWCSEPERVEDLVGTVVAELFSAHVQRTPQTDCFKTDFRLSGTDMRNGVIKKTFVDSPEECQEKCVENSDCLFFLYFTDDHYQSWKRGECRLLRKATFFPPEK